VIYLDIPWYAEETQEEEDIHRQILVLQGKLTALQMNISEQYDEPIAEEMKVKVRKKVYASGSNWASKYSTTTSQAQPTSTPAGGTKTNTAGGTDKKKESITQEEKKIGTPTTFDFFAKDDEVREEFSITELVALSYCKDLAELEEELEQYGWVDTFSFEDLERIYRVAIKVAYQFADVMRRD
jgi:hypothetical protein